MAIALFESLDYAASPPQTREKSTQVRWTVKRFVEWLSKKYGVQCCRATCQKALKQLGFSWKKARKLLNKASRNARISFIEKLKPLLDSTTQGTEQMVYIDEAHVALETNEGYGWGVKGEPFWVSSNSKTFQKVSFYAIYFYNQGRVRIYPYNKGNSINTIDVLNKIREEYPDDKNNMSMTIIWDGASYHRSHLVMQEAEKLNISIQPLPAYSPDFMPVEHLWQWLREDVTYHTCYETKEDLIAIFL